MPFVLETVEGFKSKFFEMFIKPLLIKVVNFFFHNFYFDLVVFIATETMFTLHRIAVCGVTNCISDTVFVHT